MKNKATTLLASLSTKELKQFSRFLRSPFFNYTERVYQLFQQLRRAYPDFEQNAPDKSTLFKKLFPKEPYKEKKITDLFSDLSLLIEKFLIVQHTLNDDYRRSKAKAEIFGKRNLHPLFENEVRKLIKHIEEIPYPNADSFKERLHINELFYLHPNIPSFVSNLPHPKEIMSQVDQHFLINKLKYGCELLSRQNILNEQHQIHLLEESLQLLEYYQSDAMPLLLLYGRLVRLLLKDRHDQQFTELRNLYWQRVDHIPAIEQRSILLYLINYTNRQINAGVDSYKLILFGLYKRGLEQKLLLNQEHLSDASFINMLVLSSGLGEFDWAETFIRTHQHLLHPPIRENAVALGKAYVSFNSQEYEATLAILQEVSFLSDNYKLWSRSLLLRTAYELSLEDESYLFFTESNVESFLRFIADNKQLAAKKAQVYLNYARMLSHLVRYRLKKQKDPKLKIRLQESILENPKIIAKKWLEEKINQME